VTRRINLAALAVITFMVLPRLSYASSVAQAGTGDLLDNPTLLFAIVFGVFVALVIGGGISFALVAALGTRFFGKNVPADDKMTAFDKAQAAALTASRTAERKPVLITPTMEPFVIAIGGFIVVFILASLLVRPEQAKTAEAGAATPAVASGLPITGNFTEIVAGLPAGNADNGVKLFTSIGCGGCHGLQKDQRLVGPSFYGLFARAGTRTAGEGAKEYIYHSIVNPNAFVVESYQSGLMPPTYAKQLSKQDMADILAYIERDHNEK
jgi:mono/diheme cytochrome c family protein